MTPISVTDAALEKIRDLLAKGGEGVRGVRLGTRTAGCSGLMYSIDYVAQGEPGDEIVELADGIRLFIDGASLMYLLGATMDWREDIFTSGFTFTNPNETGRCGCGESFMVKG